MTWRVSGKGGDSLPLLLLFDERDPATHLLHDLLNPLYDFVLVSGRRKGQSEFTVEEVSGRSTAFVRTHLSSVNGIGSLEPPTDLKGPEPRDWGGIPRRSPPFLQTPPGVHPSPTDRDCKNPRPEGVVVRGETGPTLRGRGRGRGVSRSL